MSALPPTADIPRRHLDVRKGREANIRPPYSITSSPATSCFLRLRSQHYDHRQNWRRVALDHQVCDTYLTDRFVRGRQHHRRVGLMCPKALSAASAAILLLLVCIDGASAAGGCGAGFHRGPYGGCQPNRGPVVVVPGAPVVVAPAVVAPAPVVCGVGFRWHPGRRRCVVL
jgi:hypothetical protein